MAVVYSVPQAEVGCSWQLITLNTRDKQMILPQLRASTGGCFIDILNRTEATIVLVLTTASSLCLLGQFPVDRQASDELMLLARRQSTGILKEWLPALAWTVGYESESADDPTQLNAIVHRLQAARQPEDWLWSSRLLKQAQA